MPSFGFSVHTIQSVKTHNITFETEQSVSSNSTSHTHRNCRLLCFINFFISTVSEYDKYFFLLQNINRSRQRHTTIITCSVCKCSTRKGPKEESLRGEVSGPGLSYCSIPGSQDVVEPVTGGVNSGISQSVYRT